MADETKARQGGHYTFLRNEPELSDAKNSRYPSVVQWLRLEKNELGIRVRLARKRAGHGREPTSRGRYEGQAARVTPEGRLEKTRLRVGEF